MEYRPAIRRAVRDCADRGLYDASKWIAEFLLVYPSPPGTSDLPIISDILSSLRSPPATSSFTTTSTTSTAPDITMEPQPGPSHSQSSTQSASSQPSMGMLEEEPMDERTADLFMIARSLYDAKELERVAFLLRYVSHPKARFLGLYSRFISSEKKAHDVWMSRKEVKPDPRKNGAKPPAPINEDLSEILAELENVTDPFLLFLRAIILKNLLRKPEATEAVLLSLSSYPWNYSAWKLLWDLISDHSVLLRLRHLLPRLTPSSTLEGISALEAPTTTLEAESNISTLEAETQEEHPMTRIFLIGVMIESHAMTEELEMDLDRLVDMWPDSLHIRTLQAHYAYSIRDYPLSLSLFTSMRSTDPFRIDEVDTYSNILYTMKKQADLSQLAQFFMSVNRDRPEVSLIIGNYYSLRNEHEKAVRYYQRAVQLHPTYGAAWTLMGHEFLELKNSHAAIEAYRRGIDINKKDYRAWHGLGQAYELLDMSQYALHYFQRSTALRPYDIRMWRALSKTYQNLGQYREAIECQKRALVGASKTDTFGPAALAELYEQIQEITEATEWHKRVIEICISAPSDSSASSPSSTPSPPHPSSSAPAPAPGSGSGAASSLFGTTNISQSNALASVGLWAKSALAVARFILGKPRWENGAIGIKMIPSIRAELEECQRVLGLVVRSNAGEAGEAEMCLRAIGGALKG